MAESTGQSDPFNDFVGLIAGPLAAGIRSIEQIRHAADEFVRGMENFNTTMENLNETAARVNRLLNDIEEPTRALLPQVSRTVKQADNLFEKISDLPVDPADLVNALAELSRRLTPLAQMAESAGGMFGLRLPGLSGAGRGDKEDADITSEAPSASASQTRSSSTAKPSTAKKKSTAKKSSRSSTKRSTAKGGET